MQRDGIEKKSAGGFYRSRIRPALAVFLCAVFVTLGVLPAQAQRLNTSCNVGKAVRSADGSLRLAMIIGIDDYQSISDLHGAVNDANKIISLITSDDGPAFPKENICFLANAEASYENVKDKFEKALVARAVGENGAPADQVLFYYAGHGSQIADDNGDEDTDGLDETLFLHDSLTRVAPGSRERIAQLSDDEFNGMLKRLYEKTPNVTVILDSCHSGSATRDIDARARFVPPDPEMLAKAAKALSETAGEGSPNFAEFSPFSFPNAVFISAARDRESAIERAGEGEFTRALVNVLRKRDGARITYNQLFARVKTEMGTSTRQTPVISGASGNFVFTKDIPYRPEYDWTVLQLIPNGVQISGLPTSDIGEGAEFLIYPGSMTTEESLDPNIVKARMRAVSSPSGNIWNLERVQDFGRGQIEPGDFADLVVPAPDARKLRVRVRPAGEAGGIAGSDAFEAALIAAMHQSLRPADRNKFEFVDEGFEFEIARNNAGKLQIIDHLGRARNIYSASDSLSESLLRNVGFDLSYHLRQINLLAGWKINGGTMIPNHTLQVWLEPIEAPADGALCDPSYKAGKWRQAKPNAPQDIPLCTLYKIMVKLSDDAPVPVNVAGSVLSANGRMDYLPRWSDNEQRPVELWKDESGVGETAEIALFQATPDSLMFEEYIYILGLPAVPAGGQPVPSIPWHLLSTAAGRQGAYHAARAQKEYGTYTILPVRTVANAAFAELTADQITKEVATREYTIKKFDISPYLPDVKEKSALYRVLKVAQGLTEYSKEDGVPYKQHAWCEGSTAKNLAKGIDCSRSIWYAFTRAGLPYNRYASSIPDETRCVSAYDPTKDGYLYTGDMARKAYYMSDNFEDCLAPGKDGKREFKLGDVLVYRDKVKGDGHTVMVIDPEKRIAWGSHGWDGNPRLKHPVTGAVPTADLGVEFQKIKIKQDWERWDRSSMELKACWRHKTFIEERKSPAGRPGLAAICEAALRTDTPYFRESICSELVSAAP